MSTLHRWRRFKLSECSLCLYVLFFVAELHAFPRDVGRRKDTVEVGNSARLDCPYQYRSAAEAARLRFHWSRVTSEHDQSPAHIVPDDRLVVGLDGTLNSRLV